MFREINIQVNAGLDFMFGSAKVLNFGLNFQSSSQKSSSNFSSGLNFGITRTNRYVLELCSGYISTKQTLLPLIKVYNVDGTPNKQGTINYYVDLNIEVHGCSVLRSSLVRFFSFLGCNCNCNRSEPV